MKIVCILVAAGYGSVRNAPCGTPVPKVVEEIAGRPMFAHSLAVAERAGLATIIVGNPVSTSMLKIALGDAACSRAASHRPLWTVQEDRKGSGDAVRCAIPHAERLGATHALVVYADMPMWSVHTMQDLVGAHTRSPATITMTTVQRCGISVLERYGRVVRDSRGRICRIVEPGTPGITERELAATHVNPSLWIFDLSWLRAHLPLVQPVARPDGRTPEVYLPPLVEIAYKEGQRIAEMELPAGRRSEALGVNTAQELETLRLLARAVA